MPKLFSTLVLAAVRFLSQADASPVDVNNLAYQYEFGLGVSEDKGRAEALYRQGAEEGDGTAMYNLARILAQSGREEEAAKWMFEAIRHSDAFAREEMVWRSDRFPLEFRKCFQVRLAQARLYTGPATGWFDRPTVVAIQLLFEGAN